MLPVLSKQNHRSGQVTLLVQVRDLSAAGCMQTMSPSMLFAQTQLVLELLGVVQEVVLVPGQMAAPASQVPCRDGLQNPPPPQRSVPLQLPQLISLPHPFGIVPHRVPPVLQVIGVQPHTPGVPGLPPPQVSGAMQAMQLPPPVPQASFASMRQAPVPSQQPLEQLIPSQMHWPLLHR